MKSEEKGKPLAMYTVYRKVHGRMHLLTFFIKVVSDCLSFVGPIAVGGVVQYATQHYYGSMDDWDEASIKLVEDNFIMLNFSQIPVVTSSLCHKDVFTSHLFV